MTTNTIDNDKLTWTLFHHSYWTALVLSGQTLLSQGAYRFKIISIALHETSAGSARLPQLQLIGHVAPFACSSSPSVAASQMYLYDP